LNASEHATDAVSVQGDANEWQCLRAAVLEIKQREIVRRARQSRVAKRSGENFRSRTRV